MHYFPTAEIRREISERRLTINKHNYNRKNDSYFVFSHTASIAKIVVQTYSAILNVRIGQLAVYLSDKMRTGVYRTLSEQKNNIKFSFQEGIRRTTRRTTFRHSGAPPHRRRSTRLTPYNLTAFGNRYLIDISACASRSWLFYVFVFFFCLRRKGYLFDKMTPSPGTERRVSSEPADPR